MYDKCIMTYKTFLKLFKEYFELFTYYNKQWHFKNGGFFSNIPIELHLTDGIISNNEICFINSFFNYITTIEKEDFQCQLQWNHTKENIIIY